VFSLAILAVITARGEVLSRHGDVEPTVDSLAICIEAGDSCMQQYNTFDALKFYQQAYNLCDSSLTRIKLADCYYKRASYRQAADLLKNIPEDSLQHDSFRQLAYSYQKQGDTDSYIYWAGRLLAHYPMDGEIVAGITLALAQTNQAWKGLEYGLKYCEKDSTNTLVNRAVADAYFLDRNFVAAADSYQQLLEQGDSIFNTLYSAGMCYSQIGRLESAYHCLLPALYLSQLQHSSCAYRLGVVCVDTNRYEEGLGYLDLATSLLLPDTTSMRAITLSKGQAYYLTEHYVEAVEAWKNHLAYNPNSIATHYNIANTYYYFLSDRQQARIYYEKFLELARQKENPNTELTEMIKKAEELLASYG